MSRDPPPPPGKLIQHPVYRKECWVCYWCNTFFMMSDFGYLGDREVTKCRNCGRFQTIGKSASVRAAAMAADQENASPDLPPNIDRHKLVRIQQEYDLLKRRGNARPSQLKVHQLSRFARSTVREYWPFVRK